MLYVHASACRISGSTPFTFHLGILDTCRSSMTQHNGATG
jgi:hypothetical protein